MLGQVYNAGPTSTQHWEMYRVFTLHNIGHVNCQLIVYSFKTTPYDTKTIHLMYFSCHSDTPLVRHTIGPTHHWFDTPMVRHTIGPTHHWSDTPLVRHTIGPTHHWFDTPMVRHTIGPTHHWSDTPLVRHTIGPTIHGRHIKLN